jgi:hypothetical protein
VQRCSGVAQLDTLCNGEWILCTAHILECEKLLSVILESADLAAYWV